MPDQFFTPNLIAVVTITLMLSVSGVYIVYLRSLERRGVSTRMSSTERIIISGMIITSCSLGIFQWLHREIAIRMMQNGFADQQTEHGEASGEWSAGSNVSLPSPQGQVSAVVRKIQVLYFIPSMAPKTLTAEAVVVPSKGLYWVGFDDGATFFLASDSIVAAQSSLNDVLYFDKSEDRFNSSDEETILNKSLKHYLAEYAADHSGHSRTPVRLWNVLGMFPFTRNGTSNIMPAPKILGVSVSPNEFSVSLCGSKDTQLQAVVTLSNNFEVIKATLNGKQVYSH